MININNINKNNWDQSRISIIGGGKSGLAAAKLGRHIGSKIFISDKNPSENIKNNILDFDCEIGRHTEKIMNADLIVISPGVSDQIPIIQKCIKMNLPIVSEIEFASWFTKSPIMALTGSNGKTTTVNLLHGMCICDGNTSLIGGNVGIPFSENVLWELKSNIESVVHVLEISSFQLEHVYNFSPTISAILNISFDHMDRYKTFDDYFSNKIKLAEQTKKTGWIIYNGEDSLLKKRISNHSNSILFSIANNKKSYFKLNASKVFFSENQNTEVLFNFCDTKLKGLHNIQNILAAATMAHAFGISYSAIKKAIINFSPIPHRLEWIGNINNVDFFNDSKATNIAASKAAIESFKSNLILILGGLDKGSSNFRDLIPSMEKRVELIITYGESGKKIKQQLKNDFQLFYIKNFKNAIITAYKKSKTGNTILLSPACASFDQFLNYEERGEKFNLIFSQLELSS